MAAQSNPGQTVLGVSTPTDPTVQARIQALTASLGASGLDTAKSYSKKVQLGSLATTAQFPNAVYQGGPFDIEVDFTAGGRTVIRRLESCFPGIPLRPKPKTSRAGASRRPGLEGRAERQGVGWMGKGRRKNGSVGERERQNISDLASGSLVANYGNSGSKGPVHVCSHHVYGGYEALLPLFGLFGASFAANSIGRMPDQLRNLSIFPLLRPLLEPSQIWNSAFGSAPGN